MTERLIDPSLDKSTWGDGPWQTEPDRVDWEHAGLPCLALRSLMFGNWCGYAAVPSGHPLHGTDYGDGAVEVDVHGGLTYAGACTGHICHVPKPGEPDDVWWFGFDCGHAWDILPGMVARERLQGFAPLNFPECSYKTLAYVQAGDEPARGATRRDRITGHRRRGKSTDRRVVT